VRFFGILGRVNGSNAEKQRVHVAIWEGIFLNAVTRGYPKIVAEASSTGQKRNAPYIIEEPHTSHNSRKPQFETDGCAPNVVCKFSLFEFIGAA
jgi:hypothetical protein